MATRANGEPSGEGAPWPSAALADPERGLAFLLVLGVIVYAVTDMRRIKVVVDDPKAVVKLDGDVVSNETRVEPIAFPTGAHTMGLQIVGLFQLGATDFASPADRELLVNADGVAPSGSAGP